MAGREEEGVLLYYKFVTIVAADVASWFSHLCSALSLLGRVRIAPDGINVTVGGSMEALRKHIAAVEAHPLFGDIDFKLSSCTQPIHPRVAAECGFTSLSVRVVKELITLGLHPSIESPSFAKAGRHANAQQFHSILQHAASAEEPSTSDDFLEGEGSKGADYCAPKKCVLIDARNIYETRIGKFHPPNGVEFYDPMLRQYSDLPAWLDAHEDQLCNKQVLMYCTGGVRCELASAYLRSKGEEFEDVIQLSGGIHRYLEAFADGGYFKGKNFVFDYRMAVASTSPEVVGHCLLCKIPFDDYSARNRCSLCRLLILICKTCQCAGSMASSPVKYVCELCEMNSKACGGAEPGELCERKSNAPTIQESPATGLQMPPVLGGEIPNRKLRILCLHGFRQNASGFKGRLSSLTKKLKLICEFVFVDAPHALPFVYQKQSEHCDSLTEAIKTSGSGRPESELKAPPCRGATTKYAWLISPSDECDRPQQTGAVTWTRSEAPFDPLQYESQTEGWDTSWDYIQKVFRDSGPFDGVLGFSQGAAVAAALCTLRHSSEMNSNVHFKFAVLCSGFPSPVLLDEKLMVPGLGIDCPSLHIFGGQDRQVGINKSEQLSNLFCSGGRTVIKHMSGHIIPTKPDYVQQYVRFLSRFLN